MHRDGINWRKWLAPRFFDSEGLHITYLHTNVAMDLKRGDVLCLSGHTLQPLRMTADFDLVSGAQSPGVFGVYECPWFYAESIDVYTDWPETKIDAHDPFASLLALPSPKPRQIALPGEISGDLRLVA